MHQLTNKLRALWANDFARHNAILFIGNGVVAFVNYLYYPVLGRMLTTGAFGEVQALVSIFLQAGLLLGVIANVSVNVVTNESDITKRNRFVLELERAAVGLTILLVGISLLFVKQTEQFLQFTSPLPFVLLGLSLILSVNIALRSAYIRGRLAFGTFSVINLITAVGKLIVSVILVWLSFSTAGAIGGLVAAQIVAYFYTRRAARRLGLHTVPGDTWRRLPDISVIRPQLRYAALVLVMSLATSVLVSADSVIVKHYFDAHIAGEYGGVATTARIIYFLTGSITLVLLSSVRLQASRQHNRRLLLRSAAIQLGLSGPVLIFFSLAPKFTVHLLLGSRYLPLASLLPRLSLAIFLLSFVNLVFSYDVALRRPQVAIYSVLGVVLTIAAVLMHHTTPATIIDCLIFGAVVMLILRGFDTLWRQFTHSTQTNEKASPAST